MAKSPQLRPEEARQRAEERFARLKQREEEARSAYAERERMQQAELAKTERLRALRLAKEAADAQEAARLAEIKSVSGRARSHRKSADRARSPKRRGIG